MKYCPKCGEQLFDETAYCPNCGTEQQFNTKTQTYSKPVTKTAAASTDTNVKNETPVYTKPITAEYVKTMSFGEAIGSVFSKYCTFSGRARRKEYWYFYLFTIIIYIAFIIAFVASDNSSAVAIVYAIYSLTLFLPSLGLTVRRLHDVGKSGWAILVTLIPIVGVIVYLVWMCTDSQSGENIYGPNPKE